MEKEIILGRVNLNARLNQVNKKELSPIIEILDHENTLIHGQIIVFEITLSESVRRKR